MDLPHLFYTVFIRMTNETQILPPLKHPHQTPLNQLVPPHSRLVPIHPHNNSPRTSEQSARKQRAPSMRDSSSAHAPRRRRRSAPSRLIFIIPYTDTASLRPPSRQTHLVRALRFQYSHRNVTGSSYVRGTSQGHKAIALEKSPD